MATKNIYIDSTFTETSVSGRCSQYTQEALVWGVNAFADYASGTAAEVLSAEGGTIYASNAALGAAVLPENYSLCMDQCTVTSVTGCAGGTSDMSVLDDKDGRNTIELESISGIRKLTMSNRVDLKASGNVSIGTLAVECFTNTNNVLLTAASATIGAVTFDDAAYKSVITDTGVTAINTEGPIYVFNTMPAADYYDTTYETLIYVSGENQNAAITPAAAYSLLGGKERAVVLTNQFSTTNVLGAGHNIFVAGATVTSLYGDSASGAASANLMIEGACVVQNVYAAYENVSWDANIILIDAYVGSIDGTNDKVGGVSALTVSEKSGAGSVTGFDEVTIIADGKFDVDTTASATKFYVDVENYTGGSKFVMDAQGITGTAELKNDLKGQFEIFQTDTYIAIKSPFISDAYFCATWTQSTAPVRYGDSFLVWNNNAFNDYAAALATDPSDSLTVIGDYEGNLASTNIDLTIDGSVITGSVTGGTDNKLTLAGMVNISGGVSGFESITVDATGIVVAENSYVKIVDAEFDDYTKIKVTGVGEGYKAVAGPKGVYLANYQNGVPVVYGDNSWEADITGTTHYITGEDLIWGVNAFRYTSDAMKATAPMGTVYMKDGAGGSNTSQQCTNKDINVFIEGWTWNRTVFGSTTTNRTVAGDRTATFVDCLVVGGSNYYVFGSGAEGGKGLKINGNVELNFLGGTIGQPNTIRFHITKNAAVDGNVTVNMDGITWQADSYLLHNVSVTSGHTVTWNMTNSYAPTAKWVGIVSYSGNNPGVDFILNLSGSTFLGDTWRFGFGGDNVSHQAQNIDYYIAGTTFSGGSLSAAYFGSLTTNYPTAPKTLHVGVHGDNNYSFISHIYALNKVIISADALLGGATLQFQPDGTLASGYIEIDAADYTGSTRLVMNFTDGFTNLNGSEDAITVINDELGAYEAFLDTTTGTRVFIVDKNSDVYVNAGYTEADTGTQAPTAMLIYDKNAFQTMGAAVDAMADREGAAIYFTGDSREGAAAEAVELNAGGYKLFVEGGSVTELIGTNNDAESVDVTVNGGTIDKIVMADGSVAGDINLVINGGAFTGNINGSKNNATGSSNLTINKDITVDGTVTNFSTLTIDVDNSLTAKSIAADTITIDASSYTSGSKMVLSTKNGISGTWNLLQSGDQYELKYLNNGLYLVSKVAYDTYFCSTWDESITGTVYNGTFLVWGTDAHANFADALANVQDGYTVYMVGGVAGDIDISGNTAGVNLHIDGTAGASVGSITGGSDKLALDGNITFAEGSTIAGFGEVTYAPAAGVCITVDSISGLEEGGSKWIIDVSGIEIPDDTQIFKIIDTNADITNVTISQKGEKYGIWSDGQDVYAVKRENIYLNVDYTEAISGTTHGITGEVLYYGANAFSAATAARDAMNDATLETADTFYVDGNGVTRMGSSIYGNPNYDTVLTNVVASGSVYGGSRNNVTQDYTKEHNLTISGSTLSSFRGFDQGKTAYPQNAYCDVNVSVTGSLFTGNCFGTWGDGTDNAVGGTLYGDLNLLIEGSTFTGLLFFGTGDIGEWVLDEPDDPESGHFGELYNVNVMLKGITASNTIYAYRDNHNVPLVLALDQFNVVYEDCVVNGNCYGLYTDDLDDGLANTHVAGDFTFTYIGTTISGNNWIKTGDLQHTVDSGTYTIVIANREGHDSTTRVNWFKGFDNLVMEHGASLIAGASVHPYHNGSEEKHLYTNWDSYIYCGNVLGDDFTNFTLDMEGYTDGTYLLIDATSICVDVDSYEILNAPDDPVYSLQQFQVNDRQRVFVVGTTGSYMYVNTAYGIDATVVNGVQNTITGEYMFRDGAVENGFWNATWSVDDANSHAGEIGANGIVITGGTYEGDIYAGEGMDLIMQGGLYTYSVIGAQGKNVSVYSDVTAKDISVSGAGATLSIDNATVTGEISASGAAVTLTDGTTINNLTGATSLTVNGTINAGEITGVTTTHIAATDSLFVDKMTGTNLVIDITGYTGNSRTILEATNSIKFTNVSVIGGDGYAAQVRSNKVNLVAMDITDTYCCTDWTSSTTTPEKIGDTLLVYGANAFSNINAAIDAAAEGATVYFYGGNGGDVTDTKGKVLYIDGSESAVTLGDITGTGTIIMKGNVTVGNLSGFSSIQYIAQDGTKLTGGEFTLAEGGKFTVITDELTYDGCGTNFYNVVSGVTGADFVVSDKADTASIPRFKIYDGTAIGGSADDKYILNMDHTFFHYDWTEESVAEMKTDPRTDDYLFWGVNTWGIANGSKTSAIRVTAVGGTFYCYKDAVNNPYNGGGTGTDYGDISSYVTGCTFDRFFSGWNGSRSVKAYRDHDATVYIEDSLIKTSAAGRVYFLGRGNGGDDRQVITGDAVITLKGSTIDGGTNVAFGTYYTTVEGDFTFNMIDSVIATDVAFGGTQSQILGDLNVNLIRTVAPAAKWIAARRFGDNKYSVEGDINITVYGSTLNGDTMRFGTNFGYTIKPKGEVLIEFSGSTCAIVTSGRVDTMGFDGNSPIRNTFY